MKIVLTSGHPHSGYQLAHEALVSAGLVPAQPSRREAMSAAQLHENIFQAHDLDPAGLSVDAQLSPGKVWQEMAVDLFMGNLAYQNWGWADGRAVWLLDFWKAFDPQIRFVLVYSAPEFTLGQMLRDQRATPEMIEQSVTFWIACNTEILRFYNRNPDRCLLVNASAMLHAPNPFIYKAVDTFGMTLAALAADWQIDRTGISIVASSLAKALIEDRDDAMALYRELESTADINALDASVLDSEKRQAWQEYSDLLIRMSETADQAQAHGENVSRLTQEYKKAQQSLAENKSQLDEQAGKLNEAQTRLAAERQAQLDQLTTAKDEQTRLLVERQAQQALAETKRQLDEQAVKSNEAQTSASHKTEISQLQTKADEISQENELLLLQLHQVQEELEHYFLQFQELAGKGQQQADQISVHGALWRNSQPAEVTFDLRHEIEGENWYYPEDDGRWAGPNDVSTIKVPSLGIGEYELQLDVVDAMEPEILDDMEVSLNGTPLPISQDWETYPALVLAQFSTEVIAERPEWEFQFKFPKLMSPSQHGSDDFRNMAIRLRTLKLRKL